MSAIKKVVFYIKDFFKRADMFLFFICFACACFSVYAVYIATLGMQAGGVIISPTRCVIVQIFSIFIGVGAFVLFTVIDADILGEQWRWLCVIDVLLMIALVIFGTEGESGSRSWIRFAGINVQPSEIVKVLYIIVAARQMTYLKEHKDINAFPSVVQIAAHFVAIFGLIVVVGDDLGSATIILAVFLLMFFAAGVKLYWFAIGGAAIAAVIPILWNYFLKDLFSEAVRINVPNFVGSARTDIINNREFQSIYNFTVEYTVDPQVPADIIIDQTPASGRSVMKDSKGVEVELKVSTGIQMLQMPDVVNKEYRDARMTLQKTGFVVEYEFVKSETVTENYVISTNPEAGDSIPAGATVYMTISLNYHIDELVYLGFAI